MLLCVSATALLVFLFIWCMNKQQSSTRVCLRVCCVFAAGQVFFTQTVRGRVCLWEGDRLLCVRTSRGWGWGGVCNGCPHVSQHSLYIEHCRVCVSVRACVCVCVWGVPAVNCRSGTLAHQEEDKSTQKDQRARGGLQALPRLLPAVPSWLQREQASDGTKKVPSSGRASVVGPITM